MRGTNREKEEYVDTWRDDIRDAHAGPFLGMDDVGIGRRRRSWGGAKTIATLKLSQLW